MLTYGLQATVQKKKNDNKKAGQEPEPPNTCGFWPSARTDQARIRIEVLVLKLTGDPISVSHHFLKTLYANFEESSELKTKEYTIKLKKKNS